LRLFKAIKDGSTTMRKIRVLFVCLGNICRSPLAEAIFKNEIRRRALDALIEADSCGTSNYHIGDSPDPRTIENARKNGITIDHCGRQLCEADFENFDFILAMDQSNYQNILRLPGSKNFAHKVRLMRDYDPSGKGEVPDPYHGGEKGFQDVFDILSRSISNFIKELETVYLPERSAKKNSM
jgi:protein-tyrosine phosphatase